MANNDNYVSSGDPDIDLFEKINRMTPDEAYRYSVSTIGRAGGITDEMDAAARIPEADMNNLRRQAARLGVTQMPQGTVPQSPANGVAAVVDGVGRTQFGAYTRVVDQKTGAVSWEKDGQKVAAPASEQMREQLNRGVTNAALQRAGMTWDQAIAGQNEEKLRGAMDYTNRVMEFQRLGKEQRQKRLMAQRLGAGDAFGAALSDLTEAVKTGKDGIFEDGKIVDPRVKVINGRYYVTGTADPMALNAANESRKRNGSLNDFTGIMAYLEIDRNGNPKLNRDGSVVSPVLKVMDRPGGDEKSGSRFYTYSVADVAKKLYDAYVSQGVDDAGAKGAVIKQLGGIDPLGFGRELKSTQTGGASAEAAAIRAASAEKIQQMKGEQALKQIAATNKGKFDLTELTGEQKQKLLDSANELKKYGIDVGLQIAQEGNASREKIASQAEAGRMARFTMRDDREWEKLAQGWEKLDKNFAVQMMKADTYGKRVDILEQKLKNDYDIALKKAKTADERAKVEADYKNRMASVAEGNFDLNWFKAETAADQGQQKLDQSAYDKEEDRKLKAILGGLRAGMKTPNGAVISNDDMKTAKYYMQLRDSGRLTGENRKKVDEWLNSRGLLELNNQTTIKPGDNSGGETVAGSEPPDGKYTIEKDGVSYHWGKSKNGGWKYFPDKK